MNNANFKVDPNLTRLLGETYRSVEEALKELIDNSYDADAENVNVYVPSDIEAQPEIIISDDGSGMKETEVINEYLNIASSRISRKGERSILKKRVVKGRKGIGKFAGLMVADVMIIETFVFGKLTRLEIIRENLAKAKYDLEKVDLPLNVSDYDKDLHGTKVTLKGINQNLAYPNPERLKQMLMREYGRETDFDVLINDEPIGILDLAGKSFSKEIELLNGTKAQLTYTITDKPIKNSGIVTRVKNKVIGRPINFLKDDEIIPFKLQKRIYGEIICDDLDDDVTADYGAIFENSKLFLEISNHVKEDLSESLNSVFQTDMKLAKARYQRKINRELEKLPEHRREFAEKYLNRIIERFYYNESEEKINTIISVMVEALEKDYYWSVIQNIEECRDSDIEKFADALAEFGILEMSIISNQAINRLKFLDEIDLLISNEDTLEKTIHKALENNLWILGDEYSLIFSESSLKRAIENILNKKYIGKNANDRPDLFLGKQLRDEYLLIEFKRPNFTLNRDTERQAVEYKDDLKSVLYNKKINIILLGGKVKTNINPTDVQRDVQFMTYVELVSNAKRRLEWLLNELNTEPI